MCGYCWGGWEYGVTSSSGGPIQLTDVTITGNTAVTIDPEPA